MRETSENPTTALSSFKANWLVPKSWGIHIKDTHSHCVFHFILDLVVCCVTSIYPCKTRLNGQVKLKRRKMATRVQVRVFQAVNVRCYAVHSPIVFKTNINKHPATKRAHIYPNAILQPCKVDKHANLDVRVEGGGDEAR